MKTVADGDYRDIPLKRLSSRTVRAVGYDPARFLLRVQLRSGEEVLYKGVPIHVFSGILSAESKGSYLQDYVADQFPRVALSAVRPPWWSFPFLRGGIGRQAQVKRDG